MKDPARRRSLPRTDPLPDPRGDDEEDRPTARPQVVFDSRYLLLHELGKGGMGVVWVAYDKEQMRGVALKRISKERQDDAGLRERFRREYRALGAVRHPGVPTLYNNGRAPDGTPYFTMELIGGETLHKALQSAPLDPVYALAVAIELGKILIAVHAAGIVHRDVKPSNVLIEPGGRVRLIDFGACLPLPDFYRRDGIGPVTATAARWGTGEHEIIGTPAYTDPAAMYEKQTTVRADIFSVCTIVYEAVTGRSRVDRTSQKIHPIQTGAFPPQLARLAAELRRGTDPMVSRRHRSMAELVQALEEIRSDLLRGRMQVEPPARTRLVHLGLSSLVLASAAGLLLYTALRPALETASNSAVVSTSAPRELPEVLVRALAGGRTGERSAAPEERIVTESDARVDVEPEPDLSAEDEPDPELDKPTEPAPLVPSSAGDASKPAPTATIAAVMRAARPALRACRGGRAPLTVQIVLRVGKAAVVSIDDDPPDTHDAFGCVANALARLDFPSTRAPVFRTFVL